MENINEEILLKCPIEKTMSVIGGKWTFLILRDLFYSPKRFAELERCLNGISPRTRTRKYYKENNLFNYATPRGILTNKKRGNTPSYF